jgi:cobalamin biosynthesis Mg chelatase CobN
MNEMIKYLPAIKAAFAHIIPVAVAYNQTTPYVEQDIVFPTFEQFIGGDEKVVTTSLASDSASGSASAASTTAASSASTTTTGTVPSAGSNSNKNNAGDGAAASAKPSSAAERGVSQGWMLGAAVGIAGAALAL